MTLYHLKAPDGGGKCIDGRGVMGCQHCHGNVPMPCKIVTLPVVGAAAPMWQPTEPGGKGCSGLTALVTAAGSQLKPSGHWSLTNLAALLPKVHEEAFNRNCSINHPDLTGAVCQAQRWPARPLWALPALLPTLVFSVLPHQPPRTAEPQGGSSPLPQLPLHNQGSSLSPTLAELWGDALNCQKQTQPQINKH